MKCMHGLLSLQYFLKLVDMLQQKTASLYICTGKPSTCVDVHWTCPPLWQVVAQTSTSSWEVKVELFLLLLTCFSALMRRPCLWTLQQCAQSHNRSWQTTTGSVIQSATKEKQIFKEGAAERKGYDWVYWDDSRSHRLVVSRFPSLWVACMTDLQEGETHVNQFISNLSPEYNNKVIF